MTNVTYSVSCVLFETPDFKKQGIFPFFLRGKILANGKTQPRRKARSPARVLLMPAREAGGTARHSLTHLT